MLGTKFYQSKHRSKFKRYIFIGIFLVLAYLAIFSRGADNDPDTHVITTVTNKMRAIEQVTPRQDPVVQTVDVDKKWDELNTELAKFGNRYYLYIENLATGKVFEYNSKAPVYAASLYKIPVAVAVLTEIQNGRLSYDTQISYIAEDYSDGTGALGQSQVGQKYSVKGLLQYLLDNSDNTAQNMLVRTVGAGKVSSAITQNVKPLGSVFARGNISSANEIGTFLKNIYIGSTLTPASKKYLFNEMSQTGFDDRIYASLSDNLLFAHKIGNWGETGSWHDCGWVSSKKDNFSNQNVVVVCLMSQDVILEGYIDVSGKVGEFVNHMFK